MTITPDYLLIGHVAHDRTPDGPQLGGTVAYSARVAQALGLRVAILTSAHPADPVLAALDDLDVHLLPAESSTIFVNRYTDAGREQIVEGYARRLSYDDIPPAWRTTPVVHLGTITPALDDSLTPDRFPDALVGITPQGYLRDWGEDGRVYPVAWRTAPQMLPRAVTILSDEDLGHDPALEAEYAHMAHALVVTRNYAGATLYHAGTRTDFSAPAVTTLRHPTGAGDVFSATLLCLLHRRPDAWDYAMQGAVTVASTFVETCPDPGAPSLAAMQAVLNAPRVQAILAG